MSHPMLGTCPNCSSALEATRLECTNCETVVIAHFSAGRLSHLSDASLRFIELFVRRRGNLKEMERETGQSYWALRTHLGEVIKEMGFDDPEPARPDEISQSRAEVLEDLEAGNITPDEARERLASIRRQIGTK